MKKTLGILLLAIFMIFAANAQSFGGLPAEDDAGSFTGGFGMTWIDGQPYTTITLSPDLSFGKIGVGLNIQLLMDNNNNFEFRKDEYEDGAAWLRTIRYLRYGHKGEPFYARIGTLDAATLGHGFLMWNYFNGSNYDKRKIGLALDIDMDKFGFETVLSNTGYLDQLRGFRAFVRPLKFVYPDLIFFRNLRFGFSMVQDHNITEWDPFSSRTSQDITAYDLDVDIPVLKTSILQSYLYYDYAKFKDYGHGQAIGINVMLPDFIGVVSFGAMFERRWLGDNFVANFFGPVYELHRILGPSPDNIFNGLSEAEASKGYFGQLGAQIAGKIRIVGNFQKLDDISDSGIFHVELAAPKLIPKFAVKAYYDKRNIKTFTDLRTLDYNSLAAAEIGYMLNSFVMVSTLYKWYWRENEDGEFVPVERIEPRISFVYNF